MFVLKVRRAEFVVGRFSAEAAQRTLSELKRRSGPKSLFVLVSSTQLHTLFSERRLELLRAIDDNPELGAVGLAQKLGRKQEAVSRDLAPFRNLGVVTDESRHGPPTHPPGELQFKVTLWPKTGAFPGPENYAHEQSELWPKE